MKQSYTIFQFLYRLLLSEETKKRAEKFFVSMAIIFFLIHLSIIVIIDLGWIDTPKYSKLLSNPIAAIYTPFSFILIYEVYLLIYYLPKSTTIYIGKQYEIITLIIIRRIFKDLTKLDFKDNWFDSAANVNFTLDILATIMLFLLLFFFYKLSKENEINQSKIQKTTAIASFIKLKNIFAIILIPVFLSLSMYSLGHWIYENFFSIAEIVTKMKDINKIFFDDFFTILILIEVLLLLFSFFLSDKFNKVIRNSGFIISTILIKLSFGTEGFLNTILIVSAVLFGVIILAIHNKYETLDAKVQTSFNE
ncbi:hypothetical protein K5V07_04720 [Flavobacterium sp. CHNK8]|jgi:hypothetical protein|uniref:hypothetical protein n=1 Tax=unclassified Flavobacterium TaxID=196869 RepID=UPI000A367907|nr:MULTISPECIES: hypothetical protein [unclassified Flavobacterium]OUD35487.1 hypothetical protein FPG59_10090 [Flavobacterium sp. FPG59]QZK89826.1 hypothetical protein K5V07_04720 [Flavobacterium sp. CHNK8]CAH0335178.1 hypothetical protein FVB9288_00810 [Flavobacterium sp. CECT 9288]